MKKILMILLYLSIISNSLLAFEKVEYLADSIIQKDGNYIKLMGGTTWELTSMSLSLVTDDVIIIFHQYVNKKGEQSVLPIFYHDGEEIAIRYISGSLLPESGYLTTIIQQLGEGAILKTNDGTILSIPQFDRYYTGWWLPPYKALVTGNQMYLWNLKKGKRVWIDNIKR
jgi:hypothetical protein